MRIVLFDAVEGLDDADWLQIISARDNARLAPFRDCLAASEPICGRLQSRQDAAAVRRARRTNAQSVALMPLPGVGLIAVGSRDGNRFFPGMGTLFLRMMGETFVAAMARFAAHWMTMPADAASECEGGCLPAPTLRSSGACPRNTSTPIAAICAR